MRPLPIVWFLASKCILTLIGYVVSVLFIALVFILKSQIIILISLKNGESIQTRLKLCGTNVLYNS